MVGGAWNLVAHAVDDPRRPPDVRRLYSALRNVPEVIRNALKLVLPHVGLEHDPVGDMMGGVNQMFGAPRGSGRYRKLQS